MMCSEIIMGELKLPCESPVFLIGLAIQVLLGITCTATGLLAMWSNKRP
jgi:hypothetical protein